MFVKIICSTHQRKCFSTILGNFWKIEFLTEYRQARTLQKWLQTLLMHARGSDFRLYEFELS